MRLKKVKGAYERLLEDKIYFIDNEKEYKGKWNILFNNSNPICIEIGCGKGDFILGMAEAYPDINFIAIEKFESVLIRALEKAKEKDLKNLKLLNMDATYITDVFDNNEVSTIYLNFSDPWPKNRHAKRRLTAPSFLEDYKKILKEDGSIIQKTDNQILFEYSLESLSNNGWYLSNIYVDLHSHPEIFNVESEYEKKKSKLGPIYKLEARMKK